MQKVIVLTHGDVPWNQAIAKNCLERGHHLILHFQREEEENVFTQSLSPEMRDRFRGVIDPDMTSDSVRSWVEEQVAEAGRLDVLIHGNEMVDEPALFDANPVTAGESIATHMGRVFRVSREVVSYMVKRKSGQIVFPLLYDALVYAGYPSSPMLNHGKISLMKCLSRELCAFKIGVNAMTFGYYNDRFDRETKKSKRKTLEIFGLKAPLLEWDEMVPALQFLIEPPVKNMGGQNIHISTGIETTL
jgi:3-oxoacyl-[acyl-carrier protein] reductase